MQLSLYIQSNGILSRKNNTLLFVNQDIKQGIPIAQIKDIHAFGKVSLRSGVIQILADYQIPVHFYNKYRYHVASLLPRKNLINGKILVKQVSAYSDIKLRNKIAAIIVATTQANMLTLLQQYQKNGKQIDAQIKQLASIKVPKGGNAQILGAEAQIWKVYYSTFPHITSALPFVKRSYHPPKNEFNSLLSLANMLTYTSVLTMIFQTYLNPTISYLHEPLERRYSLSLDVAEYYKPLIAHQTVFTLLNRKQITANSFEKGYRLKEPYFKVFLDAYQAKLNSVITSGKRKVTYRSQIKYDLYSLIKFLLGDGKFKPYRG